MSKEQPNMPEGLDEKDLDKAAGGWSWGETNAAKVEKENPKGFIWGGDGPSSKVISDKKS